MWCCINVHSAVSTFFQNPVKKIKKPKNKLKTNSVPNIHKAEEFSVEFEFDDEVRDYLKYLHVYIHLNYW